MQIKQSTLIDTIWKPFQFVNIQGQDREIHFRDIFIVFDYDGLLYTKSVNTTFKDYKPPSNCPYNGQFNFDARCRSYFNLTLSRNYTVLTKPQMVFSDNKPFIAQSFCQRKLNYNQQLIQQNSQNHSILCMSQDLSMIPIFFNNFGTNSKLQFVLNPQYQTVIYNSENKQTSNQTFTIQQIETDLLKDQKEASKFMQYILKDNSSILNSTDRLDMIGFDYSKQVEIFEYRRNETDCIVIKNRITIVDKLPRQEMLLSNVLLPKYLIKNAYQFLNILSKEKMQQYSSHLEEQIEFYNLLFIIITLILMAILLLIQIIYSFQLGKQTLIPIIHLTKILKQISQKSRKRVIQINFITGQMFSTEDIQSNIKNFQRTTGLVPNDRFRMDQDEFCYSYDTQQLYDSFKNLFKVLSFTTQNLYKENESVSLINLSLQIQHFKKFDNHSAIGICYNNIGVIHYNNGRYFESIENFQRSIIYAKYELGFYENQTDNASRLSKQFNEVQQYLINQQDSQNSCLEHNEYLKQIEEEKMIIFWSYYNRTINLLKALFSHISENIQTHLSEFLEQMVFDIQNMSQKYLPPCPKREMIECYMKCIVYKLVKQNKQYFQSLQKFQDLYFKNRQDKITDRKSLNSFQASTTQNVSQFQYDQEAQIQLFYDNNNHNVLVSPMLQNRQIKKNNLYKKYKLYLNQTRQMNKKNIKEREKQKFGEIQSLKNIKSAILIQDQFKLYFKQPLKQTNLPQNYEAYFKYRKNQSQDKLCKYQFSSDILFQYYAVEFASFQIIQQNYYLAGLVITNIFENCFYYSPHIKMKALTIASDIFKLSKIDNPFLKQILNQYTYLAHKNINVCMITACMSQYSQFKSDAIQSDLINDILFKDKDHFGLIKYSFQEKIYEQQIQLTNIKLILKNYNTFYKTNQKSDVSVQSQKNISKKNIQNTLDKNCCLFSDKNETQRKNITLNLFKSNTLDVQHEDCFTFRQSQNQPSKQSNQEFYFQDNHEKSSYFQSQKLNKQISRNQFSINQIDQLNKSDNRNQTAESVQASQKLNFFNSNYKQEKTPRNFMKNYVLNPKISSVLKLPIENENFSQMLKDYEQDLQKIKQTPTYNSFTDPFHVQSSPKITNKYQLNFKDKENQRKKDSAFNQVSLSFLNEDQEKDLSIHRQENFQIQIDKQNSYQEMTESNQSSFFHNKSDHGDESKHNIMNNYSQRINKKMMSQTEFTYLDNIQLIEEQDFFNFSQESLFEEQKVQTNYTHPKQYVIPQF